jgi:hypothetical protein
VEGHPDELADAHGVLVRPLVVLFKFVHQHLHLLLVLAHALAFNRVLNVDLLLAQSHLRDAALVGFAVRTLPEQLGLVARTDGRLHGEFLRFTLEQLGGAHMHGHRLLELLLVCTHLEIQIGVVPNRVPSQARPNQLLFRRVAVQGLVRLEH